MSTPVLGMPELVQSQAMPETTVNEIARILEQGARWFVFLDRDLATPPGSPADGDAYLVAASATGAWSGHDGEIAWRMSTAWEFITPSEGMAAYVADEDLAVVFDGSAWNTFGGGGGGGLSDGDYGDISVSGSGSVLTIDNDAVTYAKMQNVSATSRLLGRVTSGAGDVEEIPLGVGLAFDSGNLVATGGGTGTVDAVTEYTSTSPSAPASGLTIFDRKRAGAHHLSARSPIDVTEYNRAIFGRTVMVWRCTPFSGTPTVFGTTDQSSGTTGETPGTGGYHDQLHRTKVQTSASAGNQAYAAMRGYQWRGNGAGLGGFFTVIRFNVETADAGFRWFAGVEPNTTGFGNVEPSSRTNIFGVGADVGDSNVHFMTNDGSGTATKTDLGASFPAKTTGACYELRLFCRPNDGTMYYSLERLDSAQFTEGSATSDLPSSTQMLRPMVWVNNGAVASAARMGVSTIYTELPY